MVCLDGTALWLRRITQEHAVFIQSRIASISTHASLTFLAARMGVLVAYEKVDASITDISVELVPPHGL